MTVRRRKKPETVIRKYGYIAAALTAIFALSTYAFGCWEAIYLGVGNINVIPTHSERLQKLENDTVRRFWRQRTNDKHEREQDSLIKLARRGR